MVRTQVYLTEEQYKTIYQQAKLQNKPAAQILRETIDKGLKYGHKNTLKADLLKLSEVGKRLNLTGPTDLSSKIDDILYGDDS